jgi:AcrR family transcriptional regulator
MVMRQRRTGATVRPDHPTKQSLVEVTAREVVAVGVERVQLDVVLAEVGVSKGALYHHFGSLNELLIAGVLYAFEESFRESELWTISLRDNCNSAQEVRDQLHEIISASQTPERRSFRSLRLHTLSLVRTQPGLASKIAERQAELTDLMADAVRTFQERGWSRPDIDPRAIAVLIQAMNLGRIVDDVVQDSRRVDPQSWITVFSVVLDSFFVD